MRKLSNLKQITLLVLTTIALGALLVAVPVSGQDELPPLGLYVRGPQELLADSMAAVRVVVTDHQARRPVQGATVSIRIGKAGSDDTRQLLTQRTDARGTVDASFDVPSLEPGAYELVITARSGRQREESRQNVRVRVDDQVLLTTDKPLYKPAQVIHVRALAMRRPAMKPLAQTAVVFEISDPKGNKVFKQPTKTNDFGIAFTDFTLADEVNMGDYRVVALVGSERAEKSITVKRYVLPKFKVVLTPDKQYYLPGETVKGTAQVDYFFGKPVSDGKIKLVLKTFDVAFKEIATLTGSTDARGGWKFETKLPASFVGQPLEQGNAFLQFEAEVTDQAEHTERATVSSRVAAAPLEIKAIAESGTLAPGVENIIYVLVTRPTGEPVKAARVRYELMQMQGAGLKVLSPAQLVTDDMGVAELRVVPELSEAVIQATRTPVFGRRFMPQIADMDMPSAAATIAFPIKFTATAADGAKVVQELSVDASGDAKNALLLRTDKVLAQVGGVIEATALTAAARGTVYFDVIKDRQTMLTMSSEIENGQARLRLPLGPDLGGTIWLSAYRILPGGEVVRATRPVYVNPANDLNIAIRPDKDTYRPGGDNVAKVAFAVTDSNGRPIAAALGVNVVDESLFAIQEMQPGMEKVYFYLEKELATPRYEIHGFEMPMLIGGPIPGAKPIPLQEDARKQQAARVMLASVKAPETAVFTQDTYSERLATARQKWLEQLQAPAQKIQNAIELYNEAHPQAQLKTKDLLAPLLQKKLLTQQDLTDPWGTPFGLSPMATDQPVLYGVILWSLGPDREKDTEDDMYVATVNPYAASNSLEEARQGGGFWGRNGMMFKGAPMAAMAPMAGAAPGMGGGGVMEDRVLAMDGAARPGGPPMPKTAPADKPVRVRQFFPETLLVEPALITDQNGNATLNVPMADSITSWRISALANSMRGGLGSATGNLRCFQDFFIDIDLPVALTQGDRVSIPVAVYNYLPVPQKVRLELTKADWFELTGPDKQELTIGPSEVDVRYFTVTAKKLGSGKILVHGYGTNMNDAIERVADVEPNGKLFETSAGGRLNGTKTETVAIPEGAIADASNILVKIYPGIFSQAVEGLDSILRMPSGCFEQTSSTTYPNILVLDYMKTIGRISPEIQMKAEGFINNGYQRLVTFEVKGGGFSWFGEAPANKILTAFGCMEFYDMARVHEVDPNLLARTQDWLLSQQGADGAWEADQAYLHQEAWGRIQNSKLPPTSYITWGLTYTGSKDERVKKAVAYLREHAAEAKDPYVLAMLCNALVNADLQLAKGDFDKTTNDALDRLIGMAKRDKGLMWWETEMTGITHSSGQSSDLEATGMAALALIAGGRNGEATEVLNYLIAKKDPSGTWYSTQATVLALRALMASQKSSTNTVNGEVTVLINGKPADSFGLTPDNADVMRQVDGRKFVKPGNNEVTVKFEGKGSTLYQVVGRYYLPWEKLTEPKGEGLAIDLKYDRTTLNKDDMVSADVKVKNNLPGTTSMIIVDLGIPPGFEVQAGDLDNLVEKGTLQKYSLTGRQIICYIEKLQPQQELRFSYRLRAKFPIHAQTPKSRVYEYYNPDHQAEAKPAEIEVK